MPEIVVGNKDAIRKNINIGCCAIIATNHMNPGTSGLHRFEVCLTHTKVIDIIRHLQNYHVNVDVHDPWANPEAVLHEYGVENLSRLPEGCQYDAVILAVAHKQFNYEMIKQVCCQTCVIFDVKAILDKDLVDARL